MQRIYKIAEKIYKIKQKYGLKSKQLSCIKPSKCFDIALSSYNLDELLSLQNEISQDLNLQTFEGSDGKKITFFAAVHALTEPYRSHFIKSFDINNWQKCECPFCGSKAGLSIISDSGARKIICHLCWTEWSYPRLKCFNCEQETSEYALFEISERDVRVDFCNSCKSYIKTLVFENSDEPYVLWDLKTVSLDGWAVSKGYKKPTPSLVGIDFTK